MRDCSNQKSRYCSKTEVKQAFSELMTKIQANYVFLSYNDEGLMSFEEIKEIMSTRGTYGCLTKEYRRFKADKTQNRNHKKDSVTEYLHYVKIER